MTIAETFTALRERRELAFMPYQTAGYPTLDGSLKNLITLADCGADLLELGIPFSDPIADGPTIQYSSQVALEQRVTLRNTLAALRDLSVPCPLVVMSYLNPLMAMDRAQLMDALNAANVRGLIIPDLPLEEARPWREAARVKNIDLIFLLAPTSTDERIAQVATLSTGFIYAVALTGTTGARRELSSDLPAFLRRIRAATDTPIVVGFGISAPKHIQALHGLADGVVVASRLIDAIRREEPWTDLARSLKQATRS